MKNLQSTTLKLCFHINSNSWKTLFLDNIIYHITQQLKVIKLVELTSHPNMAVWILDNNLTFFFLIQLIYVVTQSQLKTGSMNTRFTLADKTTCFCLALLCFGFILARKILAGANSCNSGTINIWRGLHNKYTWLRVKMHLLTIFTTWYNNVLRREAIICDLHHGNAQQLNGNWPKYQWVYLHLPPRFRLSLCSRTEIPAVTSHANPLPWLLLGRP